MAAVPHPSAPRFPVLFRVSGAKPVAGSLTVTRQALALDGGPATDREHLEIGFDELREVRIVRRDEDRLNGHVSLALEVRGEPAVLVAPLGYGLLHEIVDLVTTFSSLEAATNEAVAVNVPLAPGTDDDVRALIAKGPPIEPGKLGLRMHEVWLDERSHEVIFVFGGENARRKVERAARNPALWRAGLAWRRCIVGLPRLVEWTEARRGGELLYSWRAAD
jgi:hypothetical protein